MDPTQLLAAPLNRTLSRASAAPRRRTGHRGLASLVISLALLAVAACLLPGGASAQLPSPTTPALTQPTASAVRVTTNMGTFVIELQADRAPLTVQNFLRYVNEGFYSNTLFHRVVGSFVVQGGGHDAASMKLKATHEYIINESGNGLQNKRGTVGMARSGPPHSANSQFYINLADNTELDPLPTRWGYAVFGRVTEGMEVLDKIGVIATGSMGPFKSEAPLKAIIIEKIEPLGTSGQSGAQPGTPASPPPGSSASPNGSANSAAPADSTAQGNSAPPPAGEAPPPR
jgi:cyclophilin family peptidyl-prolyl cis-trans isomerase